jgi:hypothetical protein
LYKVIKIEYLLKKIIQLIDADEYEDFIKDILVKWRLISDTENILIILLKLE